MPTTICIQGHVLEAMLSFSADPKNTLTHSVLSDLLMEITPESLRLVATDTHVLGILHLTAMNSYGLAIECDKPTSLIVPVNELQPILKDKRSPTLRLSIEGLQVTAVNTSGLHIPVVGREAATYPNYRQIIPVQASKTISGFSMDAALVARFNAFAKALRVEPTLALRFHAETSVISVSLKNLSSFYGLLAPCKADGPTALPAWLPPAEARSIHLCEYDGLGGRDADDKTWCMFHLDGSTAHVPRPCAICDQTISDGWLCLDSGEAVCNTHVTIPVAECVNSASKPIKRKEMRTSANSWDDRMV